MDNEILDDEKPLNSNKEYDKIGGWMVLPIIGLFINPIRIAIFLFNTFNNQNLDMYDNLGGNYVYLKYIIFGEVIVNIGFVIFSVVILFKTFQLKKITPRLFVIYYISNLVFVIADPSLVTLLGFGSEIWETSAKSIVQALVGSAIWIPYFLTSKRVKGTFVE